MIRTSMPQCDARKTSFVSIDSQKETQCLIIVILNFLIKTFDCNTSTVSDDMWCEVGFWASLTLIDLAGAIITQDRSTSSGCVVHETLTGLTLLIDSKHVLWVADTEARGGGLGQCLFLKLLFPELRSLRGSIKDCSSSPQERQNFTSSSSSSFYQFKITPNKTLLIIFSNTFSEKFPSLQPWKCTPLFPLSSPWPRPPSLHPLLSNHAHAPTKQDNIFPSASKARTSSVLVTPTFALPAKQTLLMQRPPRRTRPLVRVWPCQRAARLQWHAVKRILCILWWYPCGILVFLFIMVRFFHIVVPFWRAGRAFTVMASLRLLLGRVLDEHCEI